MQHIIIYYYYYYYCYYYYYYYYLHHCHLGCNPFKSKFKYEYLFHFVYQGKHIERFNGL